MMSAIGMRRFARTDLGGYGERKVSEPIPDQPGTSTLAMIFSTSPDREVQGLKSRVKSKCVW